MIRPSNSARLFLRHVVAVGLRGAIVAAALPTSSLALEPHDELLACARIPDAARRLDCFDTLVARRDAQRAERGPTPAPVSGTPAAPSAPAAAESATRATPPSPLEAFGREQALLAEATVGESALSKIEAVIVGMRFTPTGNLLLELDNGQSWVQSEVARYPLPLTLGERITIKRAALGSFQLVTRHSRSVRVRRTN